MLTLEEILTDFAASINANGISDLSVRSRGPNGESPLHFMAALGDKYGIHLLITSGAEISATDKNGNTPLHEAIICRQAEAVETLIDLGANLQVRNSNGETPRDIAIREGYSPSILIMERN
ncbi:MAG: ankyrin repeat domain-containing protein [Candidatus Thiodiazotropha lotti]|jgi:ankyrin repeat protein|uniref:Ankyrin repeat domain-containing protein n=1 Tax=Candidatus Thiodiazotropha lotti TaxID=2792787 RepID=A0A9E4K3I0_9GAMM|nr:ankyrin repeat domain-containing protein [Candidatus Thiodiazotropha lotti]MCW4202581.1 ankyrin repeat domain-containing protein [Candidatus Thiodiazotropha lotti]